MIKKLFLTIVITIFILTVFCMAQFFPFLTTIISIPTKSVKNNFKTKDEVIAAVQDNITDISTLIDRIQSVTNDKDFVIIENKEKIFNDSIVIKEKEVDEVFDKLKLREIVTYDKNNRIVFPVRFRLYNNCGFYYSKSDNPIYGGKVRKIEFPCIQYNNWTLMFGSRYGWYTEKIFDNWYYYENYDGPRKVIEYIEDDLKEMGYYDRIMQEIEEYEEKSNVYRKNKSENNS